ncbi:hypothetical protein MMPV_002903 [Pyropia vietnamensis]
MDHESTGLTPMTPAALARLTADADVGVVLAGAATPAPVVTPLGGVAGGGISGSTPPPYGRTPSAPIPVPARGGRSAPVAIPRPGMAAAAVAAAGAAAGGGVAGGDPMALMADVAAACGEAVAGGDTAAAAAAVDASAVVAAGSVGGPAKGAAVGGGTADLAASSAPAAFSMLTASPGSTCGGGASVTSRSPLARAVAAGGAGGGGLAGAAAGALAGVPGGGGVPAAAGSPYTASLPLPLYAGSFSSIDDEHVTVWEPATGKTVAGNAAPYRRNLSMWLLAHGGWEEKADELKSSKRRSAARRAKAAAASFSNLCVCTPVVAALLADARQRAAAVAVGPAAVAAAGGGAAPTTAVSEEAAAAAAAAAASTTPGTSPATGVAHLPYASEWPADLRVRLQEALVRLGEEVHAAGRDMSTLHPERWRALTASVGGGKTEEETLAMSIDALSRGLAVHAHAAASLATLGGGMTGSSGSQSDLGHASIDTSGLALLHNATKGGEESRGLSAVGGGLAASAAAAVAAAAAAGASPGGGAAVGTGGSLGGGGTVGLLSSSPAVGCSPLSSSVPTGNEFLGGLAGGFRTAREPRVTVWEPATGRTLSGNAAPCRRNLGVWMTSHPGWLPKAEEQLSSSRRARNRKSFLGAGGVLVPMGSLGGVSADGGVGGVGGDADADDGGMGDDADADGGSGDADGSADAASGGGVAAATATPAMPIPVPVPGGGRPGYPQLPSSAALDAVELGPSLTPLSPALSDALEGLLLMSGSSPGAVPIAGTRGGGGGGVGHLAVSSLGGGSQLGGVSVGGPGSVGGVVEAMVHMSVAVEGAAAAARHERVVCGKRATPSSSSDRTDRSSGFTEESAADTMPSADAMDDATTTADGGEGGGGGASGTRRISAASMAMDMEL